MRRKGVLVVWWWIQSIASGTLSLACTFGIIEGVFRKRGSAWGGSAVGEHPIHGLISVMALWVFTNAVA